MRKIDHTHDPQLSCWVESANDPSTDFPIQNLPFCRFRSGDRVAVGVGIGTKVLDLGKVAEAGLFTATLQKAAAGSCLHLVMDLSMEDRLSLRHRLSELLSIDGSDLHKNAELCQAALLEQSEVEYLMPTHVGDYTDFYASIFHATNVGSMFRPDNPLLPNYKHIPIGYHGRASSLVVSGTDVKRPRGQLSPAEDGGSPSFEACKLLDYELEVGFFVSQGCSLGDSVSIEQAEAHIFGMCLVNDWSARDMQKWEYQPLGPFLAKSFSTSLAPWVVTMEALAPFRCAAFERPEGDPQPLDYLSLASNQQSGGVNIALEVALTTAQMREQNLPPHAISKGDFRDMYWTIAQMLTHHSSNGCNLQTGDLMASGTVSNRARSSRGCLLEMTWDGELDNPVPGTQRTPIALPSGEERKFLADGDEVIMRGYCSEGQYRRIGFGECRGTVLPASTK